MSTLGEVKPPAQTPRVAEEVEPTPYLPVNKFPKSVASPVDAIVIKSIVSVVGSPPPVTPRVLEETELQYWTFTVLSPKSTGSPVDEMFMYSIILRLVGVCPP